MVKTDGGPAFPRTGVSDFADVQQGMTLRQWYAGMAVTGMLSGANMWPTNAADAARHAYRVADALLETEDAE